MNCKADLLAQLDAAAENFEFPLWECGEENAVVGIMRASGFNTSEGMALVFEDFEYSTKEGFIQSLAYCIPTFLISTWVHVGESVQINVRLSEAGKLPFDFGTIEVTSRGRVFPISLEKEELISSDYLEPEAKELTPEAILLQICKTVPREWLFSEPDHLKQIFGMSEEAQRLFVIEEWQHPSFEDLYAEQMKPSQMPDILAMVEALCSGNPSPNLTGTANTSWQVQCKKIDS
ncbi:MAG: hypothetical protein LDL41_07560 [Coleofasciculus sp. S288]|nr:hypothetical protein [Coleofasciculus sp. S288]